MPLANLPWDSQFFGVSIARATLNDVSLREAIAAARRERVHCLYLVIPGAALDAVAEAVSAGAKLVDLRTELQGTLDPPGDTGTRIANAADLPVLDRMAERLAESSRFRADARFEAEAVAEMYRIWVRRCIDEGVIVVPDEKPSGFVGARGNVGEAHVELVYVAPDARGTKVAQRLVVAAVHELGMAFASVVTQAGNVAAQRLYQSLGFRTRSMEAVLHLWLRDGAPWHAEPPH